MNDVALTVSDVNSYIKTLLDSDEVMQNICMVGEISNFKCHTSGHLYFSLKDDKCSIKAVMFASSTKKLNFEIKNGAKIFAYGYVSCYEITGQYQVYVCYATPAGKGEIDEALRKLYEKLSSEGIFDESKKKKVCKYPKKIGVISSKTGAVIHDISSVLKRRFPIAQIVLCSVNVQGIKAPLQIVKAIDYLQNCGDVNTIIIARGGGSTEDLWAFNDESVVRKIYKCDIPVISAVGHDVDYTLCDYASDVRASTPSVAAELSSDSVENILNLTSFYKEKIYNIICNKLEKINLRINSFKEILKSKTGGKKLQDIYLKVNILRENIILNANKNLNTYFNRIQNLKNQVYFLDKRFALRYGYSISVLGDKIIRDVNDLKNEDTLTLILSNGEIEFKISNIVRKNNEEKNIH